MLSQHATFIRKDKQCIPTNTITQQCSHIDGANEGTATHSHTLSSDNITHTYVHTHSHTHTSSSILMRSIHWSAYGIRSVNTRSQVNNPNHVDINWILKSKQSTQWIFLLRYKNRRESLNSNERDTLKVKSKCEELKRSNHLIIHSFTHTHTHTTICSFLLIRLFVCFF